MKELNIRMKEVLIQKNTKASYKCEVCAERKQELVVIGDQCEPSYDIYNTFTCKDCVQLILDNWDNISRVDWD